jgi:hypothetical protein
MDVEAELQELRERVAALERRFPEPVTPSQVKCPRCLSGPRERCRTPLGRKMGGWHKERHEAAREATRLR